MMCCCECHVVLQMDGATPLYIASQEGHVECVQVLLGGGAAINQAKVSCAGLIARHRGGGGAVCVGLPGSLRECNCLQLAGCAGMARVGGLGRKVREPMPDFRSWGALR
jgi:hypothetical protein